ncbi:ATP-grasp domain-containing protein [Pseudogracilibacillus sp. SE30717A]|uniref:ATP-grasp domain-containing protein n=1 Tax=Pseudogracilibacillus sp. SE30717A TaxID=3098293 RepID=UPI00300DDCA0
MKLYEFEGKKLFNKYGINTAKGWLLDDLPEETPFPLIVKTQVLTGGRGKLGGIQIVRNKEELITKSEKLSHMTIKDERVAGIYIEELVNFQQEYYLSIVIDRNKKSPVLIVSKEGGVNIEDVPKENILFIPINPLLGLQTYMIQKVQMFLNNREPFISQLIQNLWTMFTKEQAELIEINPLFIVDDGYVAGDAKVILDGSADRASDPILIKRDQNSYEAKCAELHTVGVELDGDVAIITSGAGLGMATFDMVSSNDLTVRTLVDLGGHAIHDEEIAKKLITQIKLLRPKAFLFNFYFQVASCLVLAKAIEEQLGNSDIPVVIRLKGQDEAEAEALLSKYENIHITDKIKTACTLTRNLVRGVTI